MGVGGLNHVNPVQLFTKDNMLDDKLKDILELEWPLYPKKIAQIKQVFAEAGWMDTHHKPVRNTPYGEWMTGQEFFDRFVEGLKNDGGRYSIKVLEIAKKAAGL